MGASFSSSSIDTIRKASPDVANLVADIREMPNALGISYAEGNVKFDFDFKRVDKWRVKFATDLIKVIPPEKLQQIENKLTEILQPIGKSIGSLLLPIFNSKAAELKKMLIDSGLAEKEVNAVLDLISKCLINGFTAAIKLICIAVPEVEPLAIPLSNGVNFLLTLAGREINKQLASIISTQLLPLLIETGTSLAISIGSGIYGKYEGSGEGQHAIYCGAVEFFTSTGSYSGGLESLDGCGCVGGFALGGALQQPSNELLIQYVNTTNSLAKRKLFEVLVKVMADLLNIKIFGNDPKRFDDAFKNISMYVEKIESSSFKGDINLIAKNIARSINDRIGTKVIDIDLPAREILEVAVGLLKGLSTGMHAEFFMIYSDLKNRLSTLNTYVKLLQESFDDVLRNCNDSKSRTKINELKAVHEMLISAAKTAIVSLSNLINIRLDPADHILAQSIKDIDYMTNNRIKVDSTHSELSNSIGRILVGMSATTSKAQLIEKALKEVGMSFKEFSELKDTKELERKTLKFLMDHASNLEEAEKYLQLMKYITEALPMRGDLAKALGNNVKQSPKKGNYEKIVYEGGENISEIDNRILTRKSVRISLLDVFSKQVDQIFMNIVSSLDAFTKKIEGIIPMSDELSNFRDYLIIFADDMIVNREQIFFALSGYYNDALSRSRKNKLLSVFRIIVKSLETMIDMPLYKDTKMYFNDLLINFQAMITMVDKFSDEFEKKFGNAEYAGGDDETLKKDKEYNNILEDIQKRLLKINRKMNDIFRRFDYAFRINQVKSNLKHMNPELQEYGLNYEKLLGKSVGEKINEIDVLTEKRLKNLDVYKKSKSEKLAEAALTDLAAVPQVTGDGLFPINGVYNDETGVYADLSKRKEAVEREFDAARKLIVKQSEVRKRFWKTLEAIDLYMKNFVENVVASPEELKDASEMLEDVEVISEWYNKQSGNRLAHVFDQFPSHVEKTANAAGAIVAGEGYDVAFLRASAINDNDTYVDDNIINKIVNNATIANAANKPPLIKSNPYYVLIPSKGLEIVKDIKSSLHGMVILKNIISLFTYIGSKFGKVNINDTAYMTPVEIYDNLVEYLVYSAINIGTETAVNREYDGEYERSEYVGGAGGPEKQYIYKLFVENTKRLCKLYEYKKSKHKWVFNKDFTFYVEVGGKLEKINPEKCCLKPLLFNYINNNCNNFFNNEEFLYTEPSLVEVKLEGLGLNLCISGRNVDLKIDSDDQYAFTGVYMIDSSLCRVALPISTIPQVYRLVEMCPSSDNIDKSGKDAKIVGSELYSNSLGYFVLSDSRIDSSDPFIKYFKDGGCYPILDGAVRDIAKIDNIPPVICLSKGVKTDIVGFPQYEKIGHIGVSHLRNNGMYTPEPPKRIPNEDITVETVQKKIGRFLIANDKIFPYKTLINKNEFVLDSVKNTAVFPLENGKDIKLVKSNMSLEFIQRSLIEYELNNEDSINGSLHAINTSSINGNHELGSLQKITKSGIFGWETKDTVLMMNAPKEDRVRHMPYVFKLDIVAFKVMFEEFYAEYSKAGLDSLYSNKDLRVIHNKVAATFEESMVDFAEMFSGSKFKNQRWIVSALTYLFATPRPSEEIITGIAKSHRGLVSNTNVKDFARAEKTALLHVAAWVITSIASLLNDKHFICVLETSPLQSVIRNIYRYLCSLVKKDIALVGKIVGADNVSLDNKLRVHISQDAKLTDKADASIFVPFLVGGKVVAAADGTNPFTGKADSDFKSESCGAVYIHSGADSLANAFDGKFETKSSLKTSVASLGPGLNLCKPVAVFNSLALISFFDVNGVYMQMNYHTIDFAPVFRSVLAGDAVKRVNDIIGVNVDARLHCPGVIELRGHGKTILTSSAKVSEKFMYYAAYSRDIPLHEIMCEITVIDNDFADCKSVLAGDYKIGKWELAPIHTRPIQGSYGRNVKVGGAGLNNNVLVDLLPSIATKLRDMNISAVNRIHSVDNTFDKDVGLYGTNLSGAANVYAVKTPSTRAAAIALGIAGFTNVVIRLNYQTAAAGGAKADFDALLESITDIYDMCLRDALNTVIGGTTPQAILQAKMILLYTTARSLAVKTANDVPILQRTAMAAIITEYDRLHAYINAGANAITDYDTLLTHTLCILKSMYLYISRAHTHAINFVKIRQQMDLIGDPLVLPDANAFNNAFITLITAMTELLNNTTILPIANSDFGCAYNATAQAANAGAAPLGNVPYTTAFKVNVAKIVEDYLGAPTVIRRRFVIILYLMWIYPTLKSAVDEQFEILWKKTLDRHTDIPTTINGNAGNNPLHAAEQAELVSDDMITRGRIDDFNAAITPQQTIDLRARVALFYGNLYTEVIDARFNNMLANSELSFSREIENYHELLQKCANDNNDILTKLNAIKLLPMNTPVNIFKKYFKDHLVEYSLLCKRFSIIEDAAANTFLGVLNNPATTTLGLIYVGLHAYIRRYKISLVEALFAGGGKFPDYRALQLTFDAYEVAINGAANTRNDFHAFTYLHTTLTYMNFIHLIMYMVDVLPFSLGNSIVSNGALAVAKSIAANTFLDNGGAAIARTTKVNQFIRNFLKPTLDNISDNCLMDYLSNSNRIFIDTDKYILFHPSIEQRQQITTLEKVKNDILQLQHKEDNIYTYKYSVPDGTNINAEVVTVGRYENRRYTGGAPAFSIVTDDAALITKERNIFKSKYGVFMRGVYDATDVKSTAFIHGSEAQKIEDEYFTLAIKSIASKVLATSGMYNLLHKPSILHSTTPLRLMIGGDSTAPKVEPQLTELYFRITLLALFYKQLFNYDDQTPESQYTYANSSYPDIKGHGTKNLKITLVPDSEGLFGGLISIIFRRLSGSPESLTDEDIKDIVREINVIYAKNKQSSNSNRDIIMEFVKEVNRRYNIVSDVEKNRFDEEFQNRTSYVKTPDYKGIRDQELSILPGELDGTGIKKSMPSDRYVKISTTEKKDISVKATLDHKRLIDNFKHILESKLKSRGPEDTEYIGNRFSFKLAINNTQKKLNTAANNDEKMRLVANLIRGSDVYNKTDYAKYLAFHEIVVGGLNTLSGIYTLMENFKRQAILLDVSTFYDLIEKKMNLKAGPSAAYAAAGRTAHFELIEELRDGLKTKYKNSDDIIDELFANDSIEFREVVGLNEYAYRHKVSGAAILAINNPEQNIIPSDANFIRTYNRVRCAYSYPLVPDTYTNNGLKLNLYVDTDDISKETLLRGNAVNHIRAGAGNLAIETQRAMIKRHIFDLETVMKKSIETLYGFSNDFGSLVNLSVKQSSDRKVDINLDVSRLKEHIDGLFESIGGFIDYFRPFVKNEILDEYTNKNAPGSFYWLHERFNEQLLGGKQIADDLKYMKFSSAVKKIQDTWNYCTQDFSWQVGNVKYSGYDPHGLAGVPLDGNEALRYNDYSCIFTEMLFYNSTISNAYASFGYKRAKIEMGTLRINGADPEILSGITPISIKNLTHPLYDLLKDIKRDTGDKKTTTRFLYIYPLISYEDPLSLNRSLLLLMNQLLGKYLETFLDSASGKIYNGLITDIVNGPLAQSISNLDKTWPDVAPASIVVATAAAANAKCSSIQLRRYSDLNLAVEMTSPIKDCSNVEQLNLGSANNAQSAIRIDEVNNYVYPYIGDVLINGFLAANTCSDMIFTANTPMHFTEGYLNPFFANGAHAVNTTPTYFKTFNKILTSLGNMNDPMPDSLLFTTLAKMFNTIVNAKGARGEMIYINDSFADIPLYMKEKMKVNLPLFKTLCSEIINRTQYIKNLLELQCFKFQGNRAQSGGYIPGQSRNPFPDNMKLRPPTNGDDDTRSYLGDLCTRFKSIALSVVKACDNCLRELADAPVFGELYKDHFKDSKTLNKTTPLTTLSSSLYTMLNTSNIFPVSALATNGPDDNILFSPSDDIKKWKYSTRLLLGNSDLDVSPDHLSHVYEMINEINQSISSRYIISKDKIEEYLKHFIKLIRFTNQVKTIRSVTTSYNAAFTPAGPYRKAATATAIVAARYTDDGCFVRNKIVAGPATANDVYRKGGDVYYYLANQLSYANKFGVFANNSAFPPDTKPGPKPVYALQSPPSKMINSMSDDKQKAIKDICEWLLNTVAGAQRDILVDNILDLNIPVINSNAFMRYIPFTNLYNASYTFDRMVIDLFLQVFDNRMANDLIAKLRDSDDINIKRQYTSQDAANINNYSANNLWSTGTGPGSAPLVEKIFISALINPYFNTDVNVNGGNPALISSKYYTFLKSMYGNILLKKPKFIKDQIVEKILYGSLFSVVNLASQDINSYKYNATAIDVEKTTKEPLGDNINLTIRSAVLSVSKMRFNTVLIRNLIFLVNTYRTMRFALERNILNSGDLSVLKSVSVVDEFTTEYDEPMDPLKKKYERD